MKFSVFARRFLIPAPFISFWFYLKFGCRISLRAEVEFSPNLRIGKNTNIASFVKIKVNGPLQIGENVTIGEGTHIGAGEKGLIIGKDTLIGPHANIIGAHYGYDRLDVPIRLQEVTNKGTTIGEDVWIGAGACILDGARIGDRVIVAPHSVVTSEVPDNAIVKGDPARVVFTRR
jgi:acetyltransferase-like isoleucine patch superfamily enzyme